MSDFTSRDKDAIEYHEFPTPGKLKVESTKPLSSQRDLSLAYSPGVAVPCLLIAEDPEAAYRFTSRGNLVGVVTNGTATLGLGDIGPLAAKPVMEGKAVLFKHLAGIDAFDIELDARDPELVISCVKAMAPTFGGINLEDIKAPECFEIERRLREALDIPVFHDDQHGTAIITGAALLNALDLQGKRLEDVRVVFAGAGAAAVSCAMLYERLGVPREQITLCDLHGVVYAGRELEMDPYKGHFAHETAHRTLAEAMVGADVFVGLSVGGIVSVEMLQSMGEKPIVFALANPEPEIRYEDAMSARDDLIMATGRSDHPNQVNNVLCFPFLFRGALDVGASAINEPMKIAAVRALAALARADVPEVVMEAYGKEMLMFGRDYIIPKPFDPRVLLKVAPAVALAAEASGVARRPLKNPEAYLEQLERLQGVSKQFIRQLIHKVHLDRPRRILFPEGSELKILQASRQLVDERIAVPVLIGDAALIRRRAASYDIDLTGVEVVDHVTDPRFERMVAAYYELRQRKGVTCAQARAAMKYREAYAMMLLVTGEVDGVVSGLTKSYRASLEPALEIVGVRKGVSSAAGASIVVTREGVRFFADTTVNIEPDAETLAEIAVATADLAQSFDIEPRVAMLSFSNFGTSRHPRAALVAKATRLVKKLRPDLCVDGEMQLDPAAVKELRESRFGFTTLTDDANVLVFPNLDAGNIGYKLMHRLGHAEVVGPVLLGMRRPVSVLQLGSSVSSIVNLTVVTCLQAARRGARKKSKLEGLRFKGYQ